uniref:Sugar ABC transporter substrate-binding protein n=2 Tax=Lactococcus lactis TaxID=1358 RepID=A0AAC9W810_LACLL
MTLLAVLTLSACGSNNASQTNSKDSSPQTQSSQSSSSTQTSNFEQPTNDFTTNEVEKEIQSLGFQNVPYQANQGGDVYLPDDGTYSYNSNGNPDKNIDSIYFLATENGSMVFIERILDISKTPGNTNTWVIGTSGGDDQRTLTSLSQIGQFVPQSN